MYIYTVITVYKTGSGGKSQRRSFPSDIVVVYYQQELKESSRENLKVAEVAERQVVETGGPAD